MFISFDNGGHWQSFQLNLPNIPVTDIKLHRNDLIVSTQGRAFWILDNISSLHQLTPQVSTADAHLFKPRDGYRTRVNPTALGPTIEYYLPSAPNGAVTVEILDAKGAVINSYNSDAPAPTGRGGRGGVVGAGETQTEDPDAAPTRRFGPPPPRVTKTAGLNRVVWDVRNKEGVTLPPGQYQARLKVGDKTSTEPFNVLIDPRVGRQRADHRCRWGELKIHERHQKEQVFCEKNDASVDHARKFP